MNEVAQNKLNQIQALMKQKDDIDTQIEKLLTEKQVILANPLPPEQDTKG